MNARDSLNHFVWQDCLTPDLDLALGYFERLVFTDVGGAVLAAYEISDSFSIPSTVNENEFVWRRLFSVDNQKSADFYQGLFDWQTSSASESSMTFCDQHKNPVGDMVSGASWVDTDTWVYFIRVDAVSASISVIEDQNGSVIQKARIQDGSAIVTRDPQGAVIGFVE